MRIFSSETDLYLQNFEFKSHKDSIKMKISSNYSSDYFLPLYSIIAYDLNIRSLGLGFLYSLKKSKILEQTL